MMLFFYLVEEFDHIKKSINLEVYAWNKFKTQSGDIVIKLVEDFDHIVDCLYLEVKAWN